MQWKENKSADWFACLIFDLTGNKRLDAVDAKFFIITIWFWLISITSFFFCSFAKSMMYAISNDVKSNWIVDWTHWLCILWLDEKIAYQRLIIPKSKGKKGIVKISITNIFFTSVHFVPSSADLRSCNQLTHICMRHNTWTAVGSKRIDKKCSMHANSFGETIYFHFNGSVFSIKQWFMN